MAEPDDAVEVAPSRGGSKKLIIAAAGVALLAGGGLGYFGSDMLGGDEEAAEEVEEVASGVYYTLDSFNVNLRGGTRVLRMEVQVEVPEEGLEGMDGHKPRLRDSVIMAASDYTYNELEGTSGKVRLRDELLARLRAVSGDVEISDVLFTQFVVQ